jgi:hypothetical protein
MRRDEMDQYRPYSAIESSGRDRSARHVTSGVAASNFFHQNDDTHNNIA